MESDELLDWAVDLIKNALKDKDEKVRKTLLIHAIKCIIEAREARKE